jgi:hypothetical protein
LGNAGKVAMNALITSMTVEATHQIDVILAAVFGMQGHLQEDIPVAMRMGDAKNPAVQVFGGGVWLQDQPNNGLPEWAGQIGKQMVCHAIPDKTPISNKSIETSNILGGGKEIERHRSRHPRRLTPG